MAGNDNKDVDFLKHHLPVGPGDDTLHFDTLTDTAKRIEAQEISPVELTQYMLDRIAAVDSGLHSYTAVTADRALASARQAESEIRGGRYRGPLHGMPIGIKDLCYTRGVATAGGTTVLANSIPTYDATVVARLEAAGAVILGKLVLCEGAFGPYHPDMPVPVNPWNAARWSGVSSSGSGVATAAGLCFGSVATDTGGSIRYPSTANGCVGLKPTYGRVIRHGVLGLAASMDHVGPMTRSVEDAAVMFEAMAGHDPKDPTSLADPVDTVRTGLAAGVRGLRIGFDRRYATDDVDADVARAIDDVLAALTQLGAVVVDVTMPDVSGVSAAWFELCAAEAVAANAATYPSRAGEYGPGFREVLDYGVRVSATSYGNADRIRNDLATSIERMLSTVDCMVCPSMANSARAALANASTPETDEDWSGLVRNDIHTKPFNFSGSPTLSLPFGFSNDGLPLSVQFVGRRLSEAMLCRIGYAYERSSGWHARHPPLGAPSLRS